MPNIAVSLSIGIATLIVGCAGDENVLALLQSQVKSGSSNAGTHQETKACDADASLCPEACTPKTCTTVRPTNSLITDWKDVGALGMFVDNDSCRHPNESWWQSFFGGPYVYPAVNPCADAAAPAYPLAQTTKDEWNVTGTVGTWSGFGLWFAPCMVDLSVYKGISITIWGEVGDTHRVTLNANTSENSPPDKCLTNVGTCSGGAAGCRSASVELEVPSIPGTPVTVLWSDFANGLPHAGVNPTQITGLNFALNRTEWGTTITPPFPIDVHVGTIMLVK